MAADVVVLTDLAEVVIVDAIDAVALEWKYIGWGTGTTPAAKGATACQTEGAETSTTKVTGTTSQPTADKYQVVGTVTCAGAGKAITNAGMFDHATTGALMMYATFDAINVGVGDSIQFTFLLEIT